MLLNFLIIILRSFQKQKQKAIKETRLKILTRKQMFQRLQIALAQLKVGNNSKNVLNEIRKIIYSLYQLKY